VPDELIRIAVLSDAKHEISLKDTIVVTDRKVRERIVIRYVIVMAIVYDKSVTIQFTGSE
jgi:hypothetical protein